MIKIIAIVALTLCTGIVWGNPQKIPDDMNSSPTRSVSSTDASSVDEELKDILERYNFVPKKLEWTDVFAMLDRFNSLQHRFDRK
jgi:hypothetical protein